MLQMVYLVLNFWEEPAVHAQLECGPRVSGASLLSDMTP